MNNLFSKLTHFFSAAVLVRFAVSKLFAWPISVATFVEMAKPIGLDPTFFRVSTGITLTFVIIGYLASLFLISRKEFPQSRNALLFVGGSNLLGGGVMVGALLSEFLLRSAPKWPLVFIAAAIVLFSAVNLHRLRALAPTLALEPA